MTRPSSEQHGFTASYNGLSYMGQALGRLPEVSREKPPATMKDQRDVGSGTGAGRIRVSSKQNGLDPLWGHLTRTAMHQLAKVKIRRTFGLSRIPFRKEEGPLQSLVADGDTLFLISPQP